MLGYIGAHTSRFARAVQRKYYRDNTPCQQQGWLDNINHYEQRFFRAVGTMDKLKQFARRLGQCWLKGQSAGKRVYKQPLLT